MALDAYLRVIGSSQGDIEGSVTQQGREGLIAVIAYTHEVASPRDAVSSRATGRLEHSPLVITKEIDRSTPLLHMALINSEILTEVRLECYRPSRSGREEHFYTIELVDATISGIRGEMLNNKYPENMAHAQREHVSFVYQKVTWTWEDGGITAESSSQGARG